MPIPSQAWSRDAECVERPGRCRDQTADTLREGMVQTTNSKEAAKAVVGKHNPLVAGSNPAGPICLVFAMQRIA